MSECFFKFRIFFKKGERVEGEYSRNRGQQEHDTNMLGVVKIKQSPMWREGTSARQQEAGSWKMGRQPLEGSEQRSDLPYKDHSESWMESRPTRAKAELKLL